MVLHALPCLPWIVGSKVVLNFSLVSLFSPPNPPLKVSPSCTALDHVPGPEGCAMVPEE